jgi:hypothetical protein
MRFRGTHAGISRTWARSDTVQHGHSQSEDFPHTVLKKPWMERSSGLICHWNLVKERYYTSYLIYFSIAISRASCPIFLHLSYFSSLDSLRL